MEVLEISFIIYASMMVTVLNGAESKNQDKIHEVTSIHDFKTKVYNITNNDLMVISFFSMENNIFGMHCKHLAPELDLLAQQFKKNVMFLKVDITKRPELAHEYNVSVVPAFTFIKNGVKLYEIVTNIPGNVEKLITIYKDKPLDVLSPLHPQNVDEVREVTSVDDLQNQLAEAGNKTVMIKFCDRKNHDFGVACMEMAVKMDEWAKKMTNFRFLKGDIRKHPELASRYDIYSIPEFIFFRKGRIIREVGSTDPNIMERIIDKYNKQG